MVTRAIIPAAGLGTRMARLTKGGVKEMLPLSGKPMIYYSVEEAVRAGMREILVVLSPDRKEVRDYLRGEGLDVSLSFINQPEPYGVADAVSRCSDYVRNEPFAVLLPDTVFSSRTPAITQVMRAFEEHQLSIIGCIQVSSERARLYGNCGRVEEYRPVDERVIQITKLQDKESGEFSTLGKEKVLRTFPRYVYLPDVLEEITRVRDRTTGEVDDVPVLQELARERRLLGVILEGEGYDLGNPNGYEYGQGLDLARSE